MPPAQATLFNMPQSEWENLASLLSLATAILAAAVLLLRILPSRFIASAEATFRRWSAAPTLWFVLLPTISLTLNLGIAWHKFHGPPVPIIHDEFSYLLAGDTFAHGRLTNPSPKFFEHFETPQELMRPTRMSKYPPGQGLFIALGQVLMQTPIVGIWISTAAACMAIYWMLLGFFSRPWALLGGWIAVASPTLLAWSQVYWGGCVAVLGGALMLGGWGRLMRQSAIRPAVMMWIGVAILANSRPFEGMMVCGPLLIGLLFSSKAHLAAVGLRNNPLRAWLLPGLIVLGLTGAWMAYYNHRVTGNALRLPFTEYTRQYDVYPKFWLQSLRPTPDYHNRSQKWLHTDFEKGQYAQLRTLSGFLLIAPLRAGSLLSENLKLAALFIPFGIALFLLRDPRVRWCFISAAILLVALLCENFDLPHYSAPVFPVLLALVIAGLGKLWNWSAAPSSGNSGDGGGEGGFANRHLSTDQNHPHPNPLPEYRERGPEIVSRGRLLAIAIMIGFAVGAVMCIVEGLSRDSQIVQQTRLVDKAGLDTGRHLIFVDYGPMTEMTNGFANEFVFNPADLNDSRIIWARYFGPVEDRPVAEYFTGRTVWILSVAGKLELKPYLREQSH